MNQRQSDRRKIDPTRGTTPGVGSPNDNDRMAIGPTQLVFAETNRRLAVDKILVHGLRALGASGFHVMAGEMATERTRAIKLAAGRWIADARNLMITRPCGVGKTWLACAPSVNAPAETT